MSMTHEQLIAECFQWHWNEFPWERRMLYGVNNNSKDWMEGAKNKAKGVVAGVLDFCYITYSGRSVYLDGKVGADKLSKEQIEFCDLLDQRGILWFLFSSLEEFQIIIKSLQDG